MDPNPSKKRRLSHLGLRSLVGLIFVVALFLAMFRPFIQEPLRWIERQLYVRSNQADIYRHINDGPLVTRKFAEAVRSGHYEDARNMTTTGFRRRINAANFVDLMKQSPLIKDTSDTIVGTMSFDASRTRFVSEYVLRCGPDEDLVAVIIVTESGVLKVDVIGRKDPATLITP